MPDISIRYPGHPLYSYNQLEIDDDIEIFTQCIEVLLYTPSYSVIGEESFGGNLEDFLFKLNIDINSLTKSVIEMINREIPDSNLFKIEGTGEMFEQASDLIGVISLNITKKDVATKNKKMELVIRDGKR